MLYDIINPSDPYTIEAEEFIDAALAVFVLGNSYGLTALEEGGEDVPIFIFGGAAEWFRERFKIEAQEAYDQRRLRVAGVLLSAIIGGKSEREMVKKTLSMIPPEKQAEWLEMHHDTKRSSTNDIGSYARRYGQAIMDTEEDKP